MLLFIEVAVLLFTTKYIFSLELLEEGVTSGKQNRDDIKLFVLPLWKLNAMPLISCCASESRL